MFCSKCGATLKEGTKFCEKCGQPVAAPAAEQPADATKKPQDLAGNVKGKLASASKQTLIGLGAFVLCVLLLFVGILNATNGEIYKIPVLSIGGELEDIAEDAKDEIKDDLEYLEEQLEDSDLSKKEEKLAKDFLKKASKLTDTFSIRNVKLMLKSAEKVDESIPTSGFSGELEQITNALSVIQAVLWIFMLIPLVLTLIAGLRKNFIVGIIAACFAGIFFLLFGGILWGLLATAGYVLQIISYYQQKKERQAAAA